MRILYLHGAGVGPGGLKPTYLIRQGHEVLNPALTNDFEQSLSVAQEAFDRGQPQVVVGSSRGGAVAMNINTADVPLVLLCPAWRYWGAASSVKPQTEIIHSMGDETIPFADSLALIEASGLPNSALIVVGQDHRLADEASLAAMNQAVLRAGGSLTD